MVILTLYKDDRDRRHRLFELYGPGRFRCDVIVHVPRSIDFQNSVSDVLENLPRDRRSRGGHEVSCRNSSDDDREWSSTSFLIDKNCDSRNIRELAYEAGLDLLKLLGKPAIRLPALIRQFDPGEPSIASLVSLHTRNWLLE